MRVLLTNDDGLESPGLAALAAGLAATCEVDVVAPAMNQSAVARSITLRRELAVEERRVEGAARAFAVHGTPVDCVRLALLGLVEPFDVVVSGANLGLNAGDDVTYSGTVAAALEGALMGFPAIAVSQQSKAEEHGWPRDEGPDAYDFTAGARFVSSLVGALGSTVVPRGLVINVNCPGREPTGACVASLGKRIYQDELRFLGEEGGVRRYSVYGLDASHHEEAGTDFAALGEGKIAVTPLSIDLAYVGVSALLDSLCLWP